MASRITPDDIRPGPSGWLTPDEYEAFENDPDVVAEEMAINVCEEASQLLQKRGISRAELAEKIGVSRAYISKLFNAPPNMTLRSVAQISLALGLKPHTSIFHNCEEAAQRTAQPVASVPDATESIVVSQLPLDLIRQDPTPWDTYEARISFMTATDSVLSGQDTTAGSIGIFYDQRPPRTAERRVREPAFSAVA